MVDADRKKVTWNELYKKIYLSKEWPFWDMFDFDSIDNYGVVKIKKVINGNSDERLAEFQKKYPEFKMSGDADFGLKGTKQIQKMHQFPNFSLMPVTGGMNNRKGRLSKNNRPTYNDIFPLFLYKLSLFWKVKSEEQLSYIIDNLWYNPHENRSINAKNTAICLMDYLLLFNDIYEYSKRIYLIGKELTEELCGFGKKSKSENKGDDYLDMAERYFSARKEIFISKGVNQQIIGFDISEDRFE
ncbi:MAG: hypothetical protein IJI65_01935 [Lachnospiraceae bacterium]|nr:hypothetical protein [Lachnospiraceae bacterium]